MIISYLKISNFIYNVEKKWSFIYERVIYIFKISKQFCNGHVKRSKCVFKDSLIISLIKTE